MNFVVLVNENYTEICMVPRETWHAGAKHARRDIEGRLLHVIHEFSAESWEEASAVHRNNLDTGAYKKS